MRPEIENFRLGYALVFEAFSSKQAWLVQTAKFLPTPRQDTHDAFHVKQTTTNGQGRCPLRFGPSWSRVVVETDFCRHGTVTPSTGNRRGISKDFTAGNPGDPLAGGWGRVSLRTA